MLCLIVNPAFSICLISFLSRRGESVAVSLVAGVEEDKLLMMTYPLALRTWPTFKS